MPKAIRLPIDLWPAADRERWQRANTAVDFFDAAASAAGWSAKTRYQAQAAYGRWLSFLTQEHAEVLESSLEDRADRARVRAYVETLALRIKPMSIAAELGHLILALRKLAPAPTGAGCGNGNTGTRRPRFHGRSDTRWFTRHASSNSGAR